MRLRRCVGAAVVLVLNVCGEAFAAEAAVRPDSIIREIYETKIASGAERSFEATDTIVSSKFTPELKALYQKAQHASEPVIDFDIFYDAQDFSISDLKVKVLRNEGSRAEVEASFRNYGEPTAVVFDMTLEAGAWKIADVRYASGYALKQIIADVP
jgi:hypothetical protein